MRSIFKAGGLALFLCVLALSDASAAEKSPPSSDPGEEIKDGAIRFGQGIRDGAIKAWDTVRSAFDSDASKKSHDAPAPKKAPDAPQGGK
jgi:hypothetical protein